MVHFLYLTFGAHKEIGSALPVDDDGQGLGRAASRATHLWEAPSSSFYKERERGNNRGRGSFVGWERSGQTAANNAGTHAARSAATHHALPGVDERVGGQANTGLQAVSAPVHSQQDES